MELISHIYANATFSSINFELSTITIIRLKT